MKKTTFIEQGTWYKGNTHTHSTVSDGNMTPAQLADLYRINGYSFLALTDHRIYGVHEDLCREDFLILPGIEIHCADVDGAALGHHVVGLGLPGKYTLRHGERVQYDEGPQGKSLPEIIQFLRETGNFCIYAHPSWHLVKYDFFAALKGVDAVEVYNHTCHLASLNGDSEAHWNSKLWNGESLMAIASDDTHQNYKDYFGGFIVVKAASLTHQNIMDSLVSGSFYASQGPAIEDFYVEDGVAMLKTSPCSILGIESNVLPGWASFNSDSPTTLFEHPLCGAETYVRGVCVDDQGRRAWTQPIWLKP